MNVLYQNHGLKSHIRVSCQAMASKEWKEDLVMVPAALEKCVFLCVWSHWRSITGEFPYMGHLTVWCHLSRYKSSPHVPKWHKSCFLLPPTGDRRLLQMWETLTSCLHEDSAEKEEPRELNLWLKWANKTVFMEWVSHFCSERWNFNIRAPSYKQRRKVSVFCKLPITESKGKTTVKDF